MLQQKAGIYHVDIVTAFLYAELKEPIEIELLEG
ncbi:hypothetical protein PDIP_26320 [Penicillium digitatum Pd1]|uniref:Uncharacterized protein n=1 Tax=Penicillium digitatum (strain Pd1 / CECT 20795) TaxID=1170230 RepID=K9H0G5_PEND1|nr:hypothetical protein PDIP_26320 [Penicillium digitatum Pd1]EKV18686.1 hypothetical protein PDIP_26320 [Penicillium digitatum Pd1]